jgi:hypothetical protein
MSEGVARLLELQLRGQIEAYFSSWGSDISLLPRYDGEKSSSGQCMTKRHQSSHADTTLGWALIDLIPRVSAF